MARKGSCLCALLQPAGKSAARGAGSHIPDILPPAGAAPSRPGEKAASDLSAGSCPWCILELWDQKGRNGTDSHPSPSSRRQTKEKGCPIPAQPLPTASPLTSACALAVPAASGSLGIASHSIPALCSPWHGAAGYFRCAPLSFPRPPSAGHSAGKTSVPGRAEREGGQEMCLERAAPQSPSLDG